MDSAESYSVAGSEGSISTSVASLPPQASGGSDPGSPGSRRSVSTLKKWLTNPVRKLSSGASGVGKGERQVRRLEDKPPSRLHSLGTPGEQGEHCTAPPTADKELEWKDSSRHPDDSQGNPLCDSYLCELLQTGDAESLTQVSDTCALLHSGQTITRDPHGRSSLLSLQ
ncbi:hypothetical protein Z043_119939 [Scleropages formosus]|uniref:Uncharacterized protein n=1 Tax=Scleropages formosus TaxID=113540 RepID=A0A0P7TW14_SCLFO|nr:hypothetical protein Z043_119939 [Scleropages formosus]